MAAVREPKVAKYLDFEPPATKELTPDGLPILNRYSRLLTKDHDFPGARVSCSPSLAAVDMMLIHGRQCFLLLVSQMRKP